MFRTPTKPSRLRSAFAMMEVTFHAAVRRVRKSHRNAAFGLLMNIAQSVLFVVLLYLVFSLLNMRRTAVRGDFMLYSMTGVFMFMTFSKTMGAVAGAENSTSQMMKHAPMNTFVSIGAAALASLYIQILSAGVILFFYDVVFNPITIDEPVGAMLMLLMAWIWGVSVGMVFLAARPWSPNLFGLAATVFQRLNLLFSGKMFLANTLSSTMLAMFWWNPLFHIIDQTRGFVFLNYTPRNTDLTYPLKVTLACFMVGLLLENFTRRHASASWNASSN